MRKQKSKTTKPNSSEQELKIKILDPFKEYIDVELKKRDKNIKLIIFVLLIALITLLFTVIGIAIEAWHFKTSSYKALTEKNIYLEKIINEHRLEQKELKIIIENLRKDIGKISDNTSLDKTEKNKK